MDSNERWVVSGGVAHGRTARMKRLLDEYLMQHPYVKALVIDPKGENYTRHFEPRVLQIEGPKQ